MENLKSVDPELFAHMQAEKKRQAEVVELIASENIVSQAVMEAAGSVLTNKYAEGYPGKRYYGGCEHVDEVEELARQRAKSLFGAEHANVQPHSGTQANMAVFFAALKPGDRILGMNLSHGGHLTHGSPVSMSGKWFDVSFYGVDPEDERIDYDRVYELALKAKPRLIIAGASAYSRTIDFAKFRSIANEVDAYLMVDMAHIAGLVATGLHSNPVPHAHFVTTTTHKTLRGPRGGMVLSTAEWGKAIDKALFPGIQGGPLMHIIAAKAVALGEALRPEFVDYQRQVMQNASRLARELEALGYRICSGGTDNHLMLVDLSGKEITGQRAESLLDHCHITVNKNSIPYDKRSPRVTSGIRIGTPAVTTRGMGEEEMVLIAQLIDQAIMGREDEEGQEETREQARRLCRAFPLPVE